MKKLEEIDTYNFRPTGFPELDAINKLISLADEYAKNGDFKKSEELASKIEAALDRIKNSTKNNVKQQ